MNNKKVTIKEGKTLVFILTLLLIIIGYLVYNGYKEWSKRSVENDFQAALQTNSIQAYEKFLNRKGAESYKKQVEYYRDKKAFELAGEINSVASYQEFLARYPASDWRQKAIYHRDEVAYQLAKERMSLDQIVSFLTTFPDSAWVPKFRYLLRHNFGYKHESEVTGQAIRQHNEKLALRGEHDSQQPSIKKPAPPDRIISLDRNTINPDLSNTAAGNKTWGSALNPSGEIPEHGFSAFYFNTNEPNGSAYTEPVADIAINYAWDELRGIKSEDFGGYWVGNLICDTDESKQIFISQSHSKTRLMIDGEVIYEGGHDKEIFYQCAAGTHKVEVEYVNNWHTTEFSLRIAQPVTYFLVSEISDKLQGNGLLAADVGLVSVYESSAKDLSLKLEIKKNNKPVVLFLTSYSPVVWEIGNPYGVDIKAVVYRSHSPGSKITGDIGGQTLIMATKDMIGNSSSRPFPRCNCTAGYFHCEGGGIGSAMDAIEKMTLRSLSGFTMAYSAHQLSYPERLIDQNFLSEMEATAEKNKALEESCKKENSPDFNHMFSKQRFPGNPETQQ